MANIIRDDIDFSAYMASTEAAHRVISAGAYVDEVIDYFHGDTAMRGVVTPWAKTHNLLRFREHEVTLWSGMNGHGKSLALGQTCMGFIEQGQKVCIASMEMKPMVTLARICRQWTKDRKPDVEIIRMFHETTRTHLWLYDQQGTVNAERMLAVMRYCAQEKGIRHFVLDSLMKCGIVEDDYTAQKLFVDAICTTFSGLSLPLRRRRLPPQHRRRNDKVHGHQPLLRHGRRRRPWPAFPRWPAPRGPGRWLPGGLRGGRVLPPVPAGAG